MDVLVQRRYPGHFSYYDRFLVCRRSNGETALLHAMHTILQQTMEEKEEFVYGRVHAVKLAWSNFRGSSLNNGLNLFQATTTFASSRFPRPLPRATACKQAGSSVLGAGANASPIAQASRSHVCNTIVLDILVIMVVDKISIVYGGSQLPATRACSTVLHKAADESIGFGSFSTYRRFFELPHGTRPVITHDTIFHSATYAP